MIILVLVLSIIGFLCLGPLLLQKWMVGQKWVKVFEFKMVSPFFYKDITIMMEIKKQKKFRSVVYKADIFKVRLDIRRLKFVYYFEGLEVIHELIQDKYIRIDCLGDQGIDKG